MKLNKELDLTIGAGGRAMHNFLHELIFKEFANTILMRESDCAVLPQLNGRLAFSTDSYVVSPLFFNGGNIGSLAINGTINDLVMGGAKPLYISVGLIIEEGFSTQNLKTIIQTMAIEAKKANVQIVTGDTKVVERGSCDGIFINTSGVGVIEDDWQEKKPELDAKIIINGSIGDHGMTILALRKGMDFTSNLKTDCAALNGLLASIGEFKSSIYLMRDPTRGGVSAVLNEWANFHNLSLVLKEETLPINEEVLALGEILGIDPLHVANEGKVVLVVKASDADKILTKMQEYPLGQSSRIIGSVNSLDLAQVSMQTSFGGTRRIDWLSGEALPRIC